jgi:hypothetical protein
MSDVNLLKRNNIYYFRCKIPQDIYPYIQRRELWKSLKTTNYKTAKSAKVKLLYSTERLFLHLRSGMYTDAQMKQLVNDYLHAYLGRCESLRSIAMVRYDSAGQQKISADTDAQIIVDTSTKAIE